MPEFGRAGASGIGQMPGRVDHAEIGVAELGREFGRGEEVAGGHGLRSVHAAPSAMRTRRLILPFFSIPVTDARPISLVRATCVPPQG